MKVQGLLIDGRWRSGRGQPMCSRDPATGYEVWEGPTASADDIAEAVAAARRAFETWSELAVDVRAQRLERFAALLEEHRDALAEAISREVGKPLWESRAEVASMVAKIAVSREAYEVRCSAIEREVGSATGVARFRPHGVVVVFGPFNFPGHLPNGHIVPALLAGNTVVFKPSEQAPGVAQRTVALWERAELPAGVLNLVQGGAAAGQALADRGDIDGLLFTGSHATGIALARTLAERTGTLLALEMGGNNPLVVSEVGDAEAAALVTIQSAYASAGQRCTCARRLIVPAGAAGDAFVAKLIERIAKVRAGVWTDRPEPFLGPLISSEAAERVLAVQEGLRRRGGRVLVEARRPGSCAALVTPGLVDVTGIGDLPDEEVFGPLLQLVRTDGFEAALEEAARTEFGLAAALLSDRPDLYRRFRRRMRAGCVNWNRPTTGASSALPFGGVGRSGNHRPSAYLAADYCAFPVASLEAEHVAMPDAEIPGIDP